jgi:formylmethanofuran dehydrogenase subunit E
MRVLILPFVALLVSCASTPAPPAASAAAEKGVEHDAKVLAAITAVHGGAGPWVVAGYRMGVYALAKLGLPRGSFDLEVIHHSPREVQYSCIADGAAAATGASVGRLSLTLAEAPAPDTRTTYRKRSTGEELTLQPTSAFANRYKDVPRSQLMAAGREVLHASDCEIFRELTTSVESASKHE